MNNLTELPKYYCIKNPRTYDSSPFWGRFIDSLNPGFRGQNNYYGLGVDGPCGWIHKPSICTEITLEQWDAIVNPKSKNEYQPGDWVVWSGNEPVTARIHCKSPIIYCKSPDDAWGNYYVLDVNGNTKSHDSCSVANLRPATPEEIDAAFVLPEKWYVIVTEDNKDVLSRWRFTNQSHKLKVGQITGCVGTVSREHNDFNPITKEGVCDGYYDFGEEITFEQFKKYVLMEKKIFGYKLKDKKYADAAIKLDGGIHFGEAIRGSQILKAEYIAAVDKFKALGLLDLWFEPVYKEPSKDKTFNIKYKDGIFQLTVKKEGFYFAPENAILDPESIKQFIQPRSKPIGGYEFKEVVEYISMGCKNRVPVSDIQPLLDYWDANFKGK